MRLHWCRVSHCRLGQTGWYLYETTLCKREKERPPARMNFDQSEARKISLRDCHGRFQERDKFDSKQTGMTIYIVIPVCLESKLQQETRIITAGTYSKSGVSKIQLTCSMGLSLRADSSQTGAQNMSADESILPYDINNPDSWVSKH